MSIRVCIEHEWMISSLRWHNVYANLPKSRTFPVPIIPKKGYATCSNKLAISFSYKMPCSLPTSLFLVWPVAKDKFGQQAQWERQKRLSLCSAICHQLGLPPTWPPPEETHCQYMESSVRLNLKRYRLSQFLGGRPWEAPCKSRHIFF